jgi:hypothetical protein
MFNTSAIPGMPCRRGRTTQSAIVRTSGGATTYNIYRSQYQQNGSNIVIEVL